MDNPLEIVGVVVDESIRNKIEEILKDAKFKHDLKTVSQSIIQFLDKNSALTDDVASMFSDKQFTILIRHAVANNGYDFQIKLKNGFQSLAKQYELPGDLSATCFRMLWQSIVNYLKKYQPDFYHRFQTDMIAQETIENNELLDETLTIAKQNQTHIEELIYLIRTNVSEKDIKDNDEIDFSSTQLETKIELCDDGMYYSLRQQFINEILDTINNTAHPGVVIWGEGGLGKTSTAIWLANHFSNNKKYNRVIWVEFNGSLDDSLLSLVDGLDQFRRNRDEQLFLLKACLLSTKMPKTLIILDDVVNSEFETPSGIITLQTLRECKQVDVIVTTRTTKGTGFTKSTAKDNYTWKKIPQLNKDQAVTLFKHYYSDTLEANNDDEEAIRNIVKHVYYNPLCIELIAKAAYQTLRYGNSDITLSFFCSQIVSKDTTDYLPMVFPDIKVNNDYSKDERILSCILKNVYSLSKLPEADQTTLWSFAILPNIYIKKADVETIIGCSIDDVMRLFDHGWLKYLPGKGYQMHDIVKTMIWIDHNENPFLSGKTPDDYKDFSYSYSHNKYGFAPEGTFKNILQTGDCQKIFSENETYESEAMKIQLLKACKDRVKIPDENIVNFLTVLARHTFFGLGNKAESEELYKDAKKYVNSYSTKDVIAVYYNYAYLLSSMGSNRFSEAVDLMEWARAHMLDWHVEWADFLPLPDNASPYKRICEFIYFESNFALGECVEKFGGISNDRRYIGHFDRISDYRNYAKILDHLGYILTIIGKDKRVLAETYLNIALRIREALLEFAILAYLSKRKDNPQPSSVEAQIYNLVQEYITGQGKEAKERIANRIYTQNRFSKDIQSFFVSWENCDIVHNIQAVATTKDNLGYLLSHGKKVYWKKAIELLTEALELRQKLEEIEKGKHGSELSWTMSNLAEIKVKLRGEKNLQSAESLYLEAIQIRQKLCEKTYGKYRDNLAWSYIGLAKCYEAMKNSDEMNKHLQLALNQYEELSKENVDFSNDASVVKKMIEKQTVKGIIGNQTHIRFVV